MDAMTTFYRVAYRVGVHPREDAEDHPPFVESIAGLFEDEEHGREPPFGRAPERGRDRVEDAGVEVELVYGDVTDLRGAGIDDEFQLVIDTGTVH